MMIVIKLLLIKAKLIYAELNSQNIKRNPF